MKLITIVFIAIINLLQWGFYSSCFAYENPFFSTGKEESDGLLGAFRQNDTGDCFFLASLIAIAQDSDGQVLIESSFRQNNHNQWKVIFPNLHYQAVDISAQEINDYQLINSEGKGLSDPALGDPDIRILEIAADKLWKKNIKPKGLWDDVPMNAILMFSGAEQLLIWNRASATKDNIEDIDKYKRMPENVVKEINISSTVQINNILKAILNRDKDGISMILIDYINYHAVAISNIDFKLNTYSYIDTTLATHENQNLETLLTGLSNGQYAINYVEID